MNRKQKSEVRSQEIRKPSRTFRDLVVWQKAHKFALMTYKFTATFPREEIYGLSSQFRRAAVSIPANIAEGFKKAGKKDKIHFYNISQGSLEECRYYIILSGDLGYGIGDEMENLLEEISKLLCSYIKLVSDNYE